MWNSVTIGPCIWAYRKAARATEDTKRDPGLIYRAIGRKRLESIEEQRPRLPNATKEQD
jgi:hypothetical protein